MTALCILILHAAATWFMTGVIWFVQIVHYPLMSGVGNEGYTLYQRRHMSRTTWVVAAPMLVELITALALIWMRPARVPMWAVWTGLGGVALAWASTAMLQVPQHERLAAGFDTMSHQRLVMSNWIRTLTWTARSLLAGWMLWRGYASVT